MIFSILNRRFLENFIIKKSFIQNNLSLKDLKTDRQFIFFQYAFVRFLEGYWCAQSQEKSKFYNFILRYQREQMALQKKLNTRQKIPAKFTPQ